MFKGVKHGLMISALAVVLGGCAATAPPEPTIIYPDPPEVPRFMYVRTIYGSMSFRKTNFFDSLFGVPLLASDFNKPYGVGASGDKIYVADGTNGVVFAVDVKNEKVSRIGYSKLSEPNMVAAAADGTLYVTDAPQKRIFVFDSNGNLKLSIGKPGEFKNPAGIALNEELGRLYIVDSYGHTIHV